MQIEPQMSSIPARILPHPKLSGGLDMSGGATFEPKSGKWDLRGYRLKNVVPYSIRSNGISLQVSNVGEF